MVSQVVQDQGIFELVVRTHPERVQSEEDLRELVVPVLAGVEDDLVDPGVKESPEHGVPERAGAARDQQYTFH